LISIEEKNRMRNYMIIGLLASTLLVMSATSASALDLTLEFNLAGSTFANTPTENAPNDLSVDLTPGDLVLIRGFADNLDDLNVLTAIFMSLKFDTTLATVDLEFQGGGLLPGGGVLEGATTAYSSIGNKLTPGFSTPIANPNSPFEKETGTEQWLQAYAHSNNGGTTGENGLAAPGDVAFAIRFVVGASGNTKINWDIFDAVPDDIIAGAAGGEYQGVVNLSGAVINVPEPAALTAGMTSLLGVGLVSLRRRRAQRLD
jgi:hypothetical protein